MSKFVVALHRAAVDVDEGVRRIRRILEEITPDIARDGARYRVEHHGQHLQGTLNLPASALRDGMSLCQGKIYGPADRWSEPGAPFPDGSYALIRDSAAFLEAVSDPAASRTVWYYFDDELFVASNSQRAITLYIGRFEFEPKVVPWLLAAGVIGPGLSYNRHLAVLPPGSSVLVDKRAWTLRRTEGETRFHADPRPRAEHCAALVAALEDTLASFGAEDAPGTILSLSGGADSRAIGALLARGRPDLRWKSFTGGPVEALENPDADAYVAGQVAARIGSEHRFLANRVSPEPIETVISRFVLASEGRVDHLGGYLDGLEQFRTLAADGIEMIIRGDTCFGGPVWEPAESELAMRQTISLLLCGEVTNLRPQLPAADIAAHVLPPALERRTGESLLTWRDRLYLQFRATCMLSALTETKSAFVDVANPLLSRRALEVACALPDELRLDKALFREVVDVLVPGLPFAGGIGGKKMVEVLRQPAARRLLTASLAAPSAQAAFGDHLTRWLRDQIDAVRYAGSVARRRLSRLMFWSPRASAPSAEDGLAVHPLRLAFRVHMARLMIDLLSADSRVFPAVSAPGILPFQEGGRRSASR